MRTAYPVASATNSDLDALAYGRPQAPHPTTPGTIVPLGTSIGPGDTVLVGERWF